MITYKIVENGPSLLWILLKDDKVIEIGTNVELRYKRDADQAALWWKRITG